VKRANPFQYSEGNPCRENPITILGVAEDASQSYVDLCAAGCEALVEAGDQPVDGLELRRGDCRRAAQELQDPVVRLAFDLMTHGLFTKEQIP
jgi:hypothetical protein